MAPPVTVPPAPLPPAAVPRTAVSDARRAQYLDVRGTVHRKLLTRLNLEKLATSERKSVEGEIRAQRRDQKSGERRVGFAGFRERQHDCFLRRFV